MKNIGQFWYTSAPASANHGAGFQVVATSPGLADLTRKAIRLCRYDPPEGLARDAVAPVSFGWLDFEGLRFCFRRAPTGVDHYGRPGNFAAHILIGPPRLLSAGEIVASYGSSAWWDGGITDDYAELPELESLRGFKGSRLPAVPAEFLDHFLDALLGRRSRRPVSVDGDPATVAALVKAAESTVRGIMDAHSLSTHEGSDTARWFDIVGGVGDGSGIIVSPGQGPPVPEPVTRARSLLVAGRRDPRNKRIIDLAVKAAGIGTQEPDMPALADLLVAYSELDASRPPDTTLLVRILSKPVAEATLLTYDRACDEVAAELIAGRPDVCASLSPGFSRQVGERLGRSAARSLAGGTVLPEQWDHVIGRLGGLDAGLGRTCLHALVEAASETPGLLDRVSTDLRLKLLQAAADQKLPSSHPAVNKLLGSLGDAREPVVLRSKLPVGYRAVALACAERMADPQAIARMLLADRLLAGEFSAQNPAITLIARIVDGAPRGHDQALVLSIAPGLEPGRRAELLEYAVSRIKSPKGRLAFLLDCRQSNLLPAADQGWADVVRTSYAEMIADDLDAWQIPRITTFADGLLRWCGDQQAAAWLAIGAALRRERLDEKALNVALTAAAGLEVPRERDAAVMFAASCFAARRPSAAQFCAAIAAVDEQGLIGVQVMAVACQLARRPSGDETPAREFLLGLLDLAGQGVFDQATGDDGLAEATHLASSLTEGLRNRLLELSRELEPERADWWRRLFGRRPSGLAKLIRRFRFVFPG